MYSQPTPYFHPTPSRFPAISAALPFQAFPTLPASHSGLLPSLPSPNKPSTLAGVSFSPFNPPLPANPTADSSITPDKARFSRLNPPTRTQTKHLAGAIGLLAAGWLTRRLPGKSLIKPAFLLPADWKTWARVFLGLGAVGQLNQGLQWKPPAWANGLETVAAITPMMLGASRFSLIQTAVIAPLVALTVQSASWADQKISPILSKNTDLPAWVSRLAVSLGLAGISIKLYPRYNRFLEKHALEKFGAYAQAKAAHKNQLLAAGIITYCPKGCSPSVFCLSELAEMLGGMKAWFYSHLGYTNPQDRKERR